jgi:uncharacterized protein YnzC (UPF0291/DUF896 family)
MTDKFNLKRINELASKAKESGLTVEEKLEQEQLRAEYIATYRENFRSQLLSLKIVDEEGKDITPQKLKDAQNEQGEC